MYFRTQIYILLLFFSLPAFAAASSKFISDSDKVVSIIASALPKGWEIVEQKEEEIPWGHHFCDNDFYDGPRGRLLVLRGTVPEYARFLGYDNVWREASYWTEGRKIWIMPGNYRVFAWHDLVCLARPIQPIVLHETTSIKIYADETTRMSTDQSKAFNESIKTWKVVEGSSASSISTWKDWKADLKKALSGNK